MSSISTSRGEGSSRSRRRPDSMRCQARVSALLFRAPAVSVGMMGGWLGDLSAILSIGPIEWCMISTANGCPLCRNMRQSRMPETLYKMIVDHADSLHERVDDGRADELEAARGTLLGN